MTINSATSVSPTLSIPEGWQELPIGEIFDFKNGLNKEKRFFGEGTPIVNYMDVYNSRGLRKSDILGRVTLSANEMTAYNVKRGDVLFTRTSETVAEIGLASVILEDLQGTTFSGFLLRARPKTDLIADIYKQYCFSTQQVREQIKSSSSYTTRALTNGRSLSKVRLIFPRSKAEQTAIATALLDADALITALEKLIEKKRNIKQGVMQELLRPKEVWKCLPIRELAVICTGKKNTQDKIDDGAYPFFVRSDKVERINSYSFDGEAVLVAGDGVGTGKVIHYFYGKFDYHQRVYKISNFSDLINGYFFYLFFKENFYNRIMQMTAKSSVDSIRLEMIAGMKMKFPSLHEQMEISATVMDIEEEIRALEQKLNKHRMIKQGMMQELLSGRTRLK